jgi:hypothetical protein
VRAHDPAHPRIDWNQLAIMAISVTVGRPVTVNLFGFFESQRRANRQSNARYGRVISWT